MSIDWSPATHAPPTYDATDETRVIGVATEAYLGTLERDLRLTPEETRAIAAEVRGNLDDLAAHLRAAGSADEDAGAEAVRRYGDAGQLARSIHRARRGVPWPLRALAAPLALGALGGAWFGADVLATAIVSVSRHTDSLVVDYGLMRRLARAVFRDPTPAANVLGALVMLAPGMFVLLAAALTLWLAGVALMRRVHMRVRGAIISLVALVAAIAGGSAVLVQPTTDAMRVVTTGRDPMILAVDARAGHVFAVNYNDGSGPGSINVLDARSGALQRVIPVGMFPHAMVVDERRGRAFVLNEAAAWRRTGDSLSVVDTRAGREIRKVPLAGASFTLAIDHATGHVFLDQPNGGPPSMPNGRLQILDATTARPIRAIPLGFSPIATVVDERHGRLIAIGHAKSGTGRAVALDTRDGNILWATTVGLAPLSVAVDTRRDRVFMGDSGAGSAGCAKPEGYCRMFSTVSTLDGRTGHLLHTTSVGQDPNNMVVDEATGRVFAMNMGNNQGDGGTVSVLNARSGRLLRTTAVGYQPYGAAVDVGRNRVFVSNGGDATISILDARDGHTRGTWRVVSGPGAVAVDERTGRVFVNSNDVSDGSPNYYIPDCRRSISAQIGCVVRSVSYQARELRKGRIGTVSMFDASTAP
jgi:DNA-binding beta-propeller fold protein YncE